MKLLPFVAALALIFIRADVAAEARTLNAIEAARTLRVGLTGDYAPYARRAPDGKFHGADVAMAHALATSLGVALEIVPTTWKTMAADLQADRFDVAMGGVSVTPDRAAIGDFSVTVLRDGKRPIVRCSDAERYTSVAAIDRGDVRVVVNVGGTNELFAKANFPQAQLDVRNDNRTVFDEVVNNRADVMVTDGAEVDYQVRQHPGVLCAAKVPAPFDHFDKAYWMMRDSALKAAVDGWLTKALGAGDYDKALAAAGNDRF
ncbi:transporter substrate-binding domain-containing protein [Bradyrhizobium sp. SYSU BS000235]|uniref:transporter substrate-binding domain-containing protein n=1 Tax=Bradyrhizobium sp. SYSU BS000235 TaxID=3411332 RepID=UPI003C7860F2